MASKIGKRTGIDFTALQDALDAIHGNPRTLSGYQAGQEAVGVYTPVAGTHFSPILQMAKEQLASPDHVPAPTSSKMFISGAHKETRHASFLVKCNGDVNIPDVTTSKQVRDFFDSDMSLEEWILDLEYPWHFDEDYPFGDMDLDVDPVDDDEEIPVSFFETQLTFITTGFKMLRKVSL